MSQAKIDLKHQTVPVPGSARPGQTAVYRSKRAGVTASLLVDDGTGVTTCYDNFLHTVERYGTQPAFGYRPYDRLKREHGPYVWESYNQVAKRIEDFGAGLTHLYAETGADQTASPVPSGQRAFGIYAVNRPEWLIGELGAHRQRLFSVALYDTLGPETIEFIMNHSEVPVLLLSADKIPTILKLRERLPLLRAIVSMDPLDTNADMVPPPTPAGPLPGSMPVSGEVLRSWAAEKGIKLVDFAEVEQAGRERPVPPQLPSHADLANICYTSGTTGNPKGAILTHRNLIAAMLGVQEALSPRNDDCHISYLPLAHVFERVSIISMIHNGVAIGFYRGDTATLLDDIAALRPTVFITVPRLLNRVYDKLTAATIHAPGLVGAMARRGIASKLQRLAQNQGVTHPLWDRLLFNKIRQVLGGRVRLILTGSAPIGGDVLSFLRVAFCCDIYEGYGQTENAAGACITQAGEYLPNHVGVPTKCGEVKLVDIPEMNYFSTDKQPRGELCLRGPHIFAGYLKDPEKTREALDEDGWLHTGDVGRLNPNGTFSIIDRKKNIFKLAQGEYVAPEKIENIYVTHPSIAQVFVHGDSLQSQLVSVVVPDPETFPQWASEKLGRTITPADTPRVCSEELALRERLLDELNQIGRNAGLHGFEQTRNVRFDIVPFSVENNLLTPTFKLKRMECREYYRAQIDEMYEELANGTAPSPAATKAKL
ncbi:hypothetical protein THASP1DRAFT_27387 [Thamnocephalis sphaerospora]|uniref:Long-chain-fatty-acid--CoA ligase n=1 Tax=Thamnocephalis sphaerospora TaxID=78915 RepID=A0A4P9XWV6_9FUNG|nr:hypothetical protein THASP1DRAFT_27387 [Thamnocephalis sphaerospora]|eukprot:RKP10848.1 hypothetical protein THASP1DRAFT_27387 [Thamnocephalis sphaerospora]